MTRRVLRVVAIAIALAGVIDPPITSMRRTPPTVAVVSTTTSGASTVDRLADEVAGELASRFTVVRGPFAGAAAIVSVGDRVPAGAAGFRMPAFAVTAAATLPAVRIAAVHAPEAAPDQTRVPIAAVVRVEGARGRVLEVTLRQAGLVVDTVTRAVSGDDDTVRVELGFVPTSTGVLPLTVGAQLDAGPARATADLVVAVRRRPLAVLFFDRRPSWMSTFARRALESDPRFVVTSRVVTSRNVSTDTGRPPGTLDDLPALSLFDAVAVGAPEDLTEGDVAGLERFLRRRGGAVCLLLDQRVAGPFERLLGTRGWTATGANAAAAIDGVGHEAGRLMASEIAWPTRLPAGARALAESVPPSGDGAARRPVVWGAAVGSGRIVVSGALDAWRFRDAASTAFDRFWRSVIGNAAAASPPPVDVHVERPLLAPGESTDMVITVRDAALADATAPGPVAAGVSVTMETPTGALPVRAWPDGSPGRFRATLRAPETPGHYGITVVGDATRVEASMVVAAGVARATPDERDVLAAWTASRGGLVLPAARSRELGPALDRALQPEPRMTTWYPMRSAWWIGPFALALGGEWWSRRRQGLK